MKISVLGAGNVGCATACDLSLKGHQIKLIKTSRVSNNENFDFMIANNNQLSMIDDDKIVKTTTIFRLTTDISEISDSEIVFVMIQTRFHEELIQRIIPYLHNGQIVLFNPGYLSTAYMLKHGLPKGVIVVEAESSFIDCRIKKPGLINVSFRNVRNPLGVYPTCNKEYVKNVFSGLGFPLEYLSSVIEAAIHNPNLIVHTVGAIMSIPRVEKTKGEYYMYHEVFTPSVWKILEKLDNEKMNVLEELGYDRLSYVEACKYRNSLDDSKDAKKVFFEYANDPNSVKGPTSVDSRYISEDVTQGLVMLEALGKHLHVSTPITSSLIEIASAALGRDLRIAGRTIERLGFDNLNIILEDNGHKKIN